MARRTFLGGMPRRDNAPQSRTLRQYGKRVALKPELPLVHSTKVWGAGAATA